MQCGSGGGQRLAAVCHLHIGYVWREKAAADQHGRRRRAQQYRGARGGSLGEKAMAVDTATGDGHKQAARFDGAAVRSHLPDEACSRVDSSPIAGIGE